jgi:hypothetical protein
VTFGTVPGKQSADDVAKGEPLIPIDQRGIPPVPIPVRPVGKGIRTK